MIRLVLVVVAVALSGCATAFQVGNVVYGGSFLCGSIERSDGTIMAVDGCVEEAMHGGE